MTEPLEIRHYELRVTRGARAGLVRVYGYSQRHAARRFADKLDREYGAICASVRPVFASMV
jgi:hypothetical protein